MATNCPNCGMRVDSVFEHVDVSCKTMDCAPRDGANILGLYKADVRKSVRWLDGVWTYVASGDPAPEPGAWCEAPF